jgi:hypothetical protein
MCPNPHHSAPPPRDKYNETLAAGGEVGSLVEMLKTLEAQNKLKPLDWVTFIEE